ncbi:MAG: hypothetical protein GX447_06010 [Elusimicrobia bacterium]|nr:hypothetical protein [Elusimicrobiota bacterium]
MLRINIWIISFLITLFTAFFQRVTGPTYPIKDKIEISGEKVFYKFSRSCTSNKNDCILKIYSQKDMDFYVLYKRYKTKDIFSEIKFEREKGNNYYTAYLPSHPPAGKVEYEVYAVNEKKGKDKIYFLKKSVVTRFKGEVPNLILIPHIIFMFLFMLYTVKIFISANFSNLINKKEIFLNIFFLIAGGFILGPITQYYAFGEFWTGFPFGKDLTDNKTLVMLFAWLWSGYCVIKDKNKKTAVNIAFILTFLTYLIPHSLLGSELDYSKYDAVK